MAEQANQGKIRHCGLEVEAKALCKNVAKLNTLRLAVKNFYENFDRQRRRPAVLNGNTMNNGAPSRQAFLNSRNDVISGIGLVGPALNGQMSAQSQ